MDPTGMRGVALHQVMSPAAVDLTEFSPLGAIYLALYQRLAATAAARSGKIAILTAKIATFGEGEATAEPELPNGIARHRLGRSLALPGAGVWRSSTGPSRPEGSSGLSAVNLVMFVDVSR